MKKEIYKWIIISVSFTFTTLISLVWYATWTSMWNQNNWDTINATIWNNLVWNVNDLNTRVSWVAIPTWFIGSFYLTTCPTWWILADWNNWTPDLRWQFIRWASPSSTYDPDYASRSWWLWDENKVWSTQNYEIHSHSHRLASYNSIEVILSFTNATYTNPNINTLTLNWTFTEWKMPSWLDWTSTLVNKNTIRPVKSTWWLETRPKNTALLFCMKQ